MKQLVLRGLRGGIGATSLLAGLGIALLPQHAVSQDLAAGRLCELPVAELPLWHSWCVVHSRERRLSPVGAAFLEFDQRQRPQLNQLNTRLQQASQPGADPAA